MRKELTTAVDEVLANCTASEAIVFEAELFAVICERFPGVAEKSQIQALWSTEEAPPEDRMLQGLSSSQHSATHP